MKRILALLMLALLLPPCALAAPGYEKIEITPHAAHLQSAEGTVQTPKGSLFVSWKKAGGALRLMVDAEKPILDRIIARSE